MFFGEKVMKPFKKDNKSWEQFSYSFPVSFFFFFTKTAGREDLFSNPVRYGLIQKDSILVIFIPSKPGVSKHLGQVVNILGSAAHMVFVATTCFCCCSTRAAREPREEWTRLRSNRLSQILKLEFILFSHHQILSFFWFVLNHLKINTIISMASYTKTRLDLSPGPSFADPSYKTSYVLRVSKKEDEWTVGSKSYWWLEYPCTHACTCTSICACVHACKYMCVYECVFT